MAVCGGGAIRSGPGRPRRCVRSVPIRHAAATACSLSLTFPGCTGSWLRRPGQFDNGPAAVTSLPRRSPASRRDHYPVPLARTGEDEYLVTGSLEGNFPGGTAKLNWRFTLAGDRIRHLHIAP